MPLSASNMQSPISQVHRTSFVDLKSVVEPLHVVGELKSTVVFKPAAAPSREVLVAAWAHLLRCYTGEDRPVFRVDRDTIRYHIEEGHSERVIPLDDDSGRSLPTGITFHLVRLRARPAGCCTTNGLHRPNHHAGRTMHCSLRTRMKSAEGYFESRPASNLSSSLKLSPSLPS